MPPPVSDEVGNESLVGCGVPNWSVNRKRKVGRRVERRASETGSLWWGVTRPNLRDPDSFIWNRPSKDVPEVPSLGTRRGREPNVTVQGIKR